MHSKRFSDSGWTRMSSELDAQETWTSGSVWLYRVHRAAECEGTFCTLHNPSAHHMRTWRLHWRGDRRIFERICEHGIGHPDPDDLSYRRRQGTANGVHGCDLCCSPNFESQL